MKRWAVAAFFVLLLGGMLALAHVRYDAVKKHFTDDTTLEARSGDEPHYVLMMNSLLFDHDLELGADYRRACSGGLEQGRRNAGAALEHHTIVVDRTAGEQAIWFVAYDPSWVAPCKPTARRTTRFSPYHDIIEVPAHPVAFSAMLAAAIAPLSPTLATSERDAAYVIVIVSWLTVVVTYLLGVHLFRARLPAAVAALLLVATPWLAYSRSFFSEPMIGLMLVVASLAMAKRQIAICAVALSIAIAIKVPFLVVAVAFIVDRAWARRWRDALLLSAIVGGLGLGLAALNVWIATTPMIVGAGGAPPPGGLRSLYDNLLDRDHGLICFVPWVPFAWVALVDGLGRPSLWRAIALATLFVLVVLSMSGNNAGDCYGPRYWVPMLPWLSLAAVRAWVRAKRALRVVLAGTVALGAAIAVTGAFLYTDSFMQPANRWW